MQSAILKRLAIVRSGRRLEYFTIAWNALEGLVAVIAGVVAGSISLVGFGIDSFIEVTSGSTLLWRMSVDADVLGRERNEKRALKIVGVCFLGLAAYITRAASPNDPQPLNPMIFVTVSHVACGALVFATAIVLTLRVFRVLRVERQTYVLAPA